MSTDMEKASLRTSEGLRIGIVDGELEAVIPLVEFQQRLGVDGWIRLHPADFDAMNTLARHWVHFNLGTTSNDVGHRYAIVPIVRAGERTADGRETLAYVEPRRSRIGRCIGVRQNVALGDVTATDFAASLPGIRSAEQLQAALIARYSKMNPTLSQQALLANGCAITTLRFDQRHG